MRRETIEFILTIVSVAAVVVAPVGLIQWRSQSARERRQRTVDLLLRYDSGEFLGHRTSAWRFLQQLDRPTSTLDDPLLDASGTAGEDPAMSEGLGSVFVVLRFFDLVARLRALGHLDPELSRLLFEEHRAAWAEALGPLIAGTRPGEPHHSLLEQIQRPILGAR
jgi:hypothetical protein